MSYCFSINATCILCLLHTLLFYIHIKKEVSLPHPLYCRTCDSVLVCWSIIIGGHGWVCDTPPSYWGCPLYVLGQKSFYPVRNFHSVPQFLQANFEKYPEMDFTFAYTFITITLSVDALCNLYSWYNAFKLTSIQFSSWRYCHVYVVTIDGVWINNRIYWNLKTCN
jgi:hypothetical protein